VAPVSDRPRVSRGAAAYSVTFRGGGCFRCINIVTMKTLLLSPFLAALAALALLPVTFELTVSLFVSAGLLATYLADYGGALRPLPAPCPARVARRKERLGQVA
jgi:hypothetical protein